MRRTVPVGNTGSRYTSEELKGYLEFRKNVNTAADLQLSVNRDLDHAVRLINSAGHALGKLMEANEAISSAYESKANALSIYSSPVSHGRPYFQRTFDSSASASVDAFIKSPEDAGKAQIESTAPLRNSNNLDLSSESPFHLVTAVPGDVKFASFASSPMEGLGRRKGPIKQFAVKEAPEQEAPEQEVPVDCSSERPRGPHDDFVESTKNFLASNVVWGSNVGRTKGTVKQFAVKEAPEQEAPEQEVPVDCSSDRPRGPHDDFVESTKNFMASNVVGRTKGPIKQFASKEVVEDAPIESDGQHDEFVESTRNLLASNGGGRPSQAEESVGSKRSRDYSEKVLLKNRLQKFLTEISQELENEDD